MDTQNLLKTMPRSIKRSLMMLTDTTLLPLALWAAFVLRLGDFTPPVQKFWWLFVLSPAMSLPVFAALGFYRTIVRHMGPQAVFALLKGVSISALLLSAIVILMGLYGFPRSVLPLYWMLALLGVGGSRFLVRAYLQSRRHKLAARKPVIIYGAGAAGAQLAEVLRGGQDFDPVAMIDDDRSLHGSVVGGIEVYPPERLGELVAEYNADSVLLALPSASRQRRQEILRRLECYPLHVKTIPELNDLVAGKAKLDDLREVDIEDLLGRDPVAPDPALMAECIQHKTVMVTGAGGSIGSELCRQIAKCGPRRLVLFEVGEFPLYRIERELRETLERSGGDCQLVPLLGTVTDRERLRTIMQVYAVDTVYHAAAYKHVPIVEHNVIEGVHNNTLGTYYAALAAQQSGVRHFVLVSTDKAVRPTNVMGATKRLAEMVLQAMASEPGPTRFSMVRFGNVLGSSGSVVPLFREQIRKGGPVTVTHPEITRYFMTIPEAAALVIQAGAMAEGGDVFVLDMGEPVRIVDLARKMVHLMGRTVRDERNPGGDIEIRFTGLRPGEKLYEELLIGGNVAGTQHPSIYRAHDWAPSWWQMAELIGQIEAAVAASNVGRIRGLLLEAVQGYAPQGEVPDLVWKQYMSMQLASGGDTDKVARLVPRRRE